MGEGEDKQGLPSAGPTPDRPSGWRLVVLVAVAATLGLAVFAGFAQVLEDRIEAEERECRAFCGPAPLQPGDPRLLAPLNERCACPVAPRPP